MDSLLLAVSLLCGLALIAFVGRECFADWLAHCEEIEAQRLEAEQETRSQLYLLPGERGPWSAEDAAATRQFFKSPAGRRLMAQLSYAEGGIMARAIHHDGPNAEYLRGRAAGYRELLKDVATLFSPSAESADNSQPGSEQAGEG